MSEPLTREQVERACIGLLNDGAIKGQIRLTTTIVLLSTHDAALREQLATMTQERDEAKCGEALCGHDHSSQYWELRANNAEQQLAMAKQQVWEEAAKAVCVYCLRGDERRSWSHHTNGNVCDAERLWVEQAQKEQP